MYNKFHVISTKFMHLRIRVIDTGFMTKYKFSIDTKCTNKFRVISAKFNVFIVLELSA